MAQPNLIKKEPVNGSCGILHVSCRVWPHNQSQSSRFALLCVANHCNIAVHKSSQAMRCTIPCNCLCHFGSDFWHFNLKIFGKCFEVSIGIRGWHSVVQWQDIFHGALAILATCVAPAQPKPQSRHASFVRYLCMWLEIYESRWKINKKQFYWMYHWCIRDERWMLPRWTALSSICLQLLLRHGLTQMSRSDVRVGVTGVCRTTGCRGRTDKGVLDRLSVKRLQSPLVMENSVFWGKWLRRCWWQLWNILCLAETSGSKQQQQ